MSYDLPPPKKKYGRKTPPAPPDLSHEQAKALLRLTRAQRKKWARSMIRVPTLRRLAGK